MNDVELDGLAFLERLETFGLDRGEVNEYVAAFLRLDESIAFFRVKPFYSSLHQTYIPFVFIWL